MAESQSDGMSIRLIDSCNARLTKIRRAVYIDDISNLRDPDIFRSLIEHELQARTEPSRTDPRRNPSYVAKLIATRYVLVLCGHLVM
jgi:hypothetical protein